MSNAQAIRSGLIQAQALAIAARVIRAVEERKDGAAVFAPVSNRADMEAMLEESGFGPVVKDEAYGLFQLAQGESVENYIARARRLTHLT